MITLKRIRCGDYELSFKRTLIMGILNVTPDSFSDGGRFIDSNTAIVHARQMVSDGADLIDIGGESSRPGAAPVSEKDELSRILPLVKVFVKDLCVPISIDTYKPYVAEECLRAGAHLINDITGLANPQMSSIIAQHHVPVILMHMKGTPQTMQKDPVYTDVVAEVKTFLKERIHIAHDAGIKDVIIDPGIGFGKTVDHNLQILKHLSSLTSLKHPILIGPSRKNFIGILTGLPVTDRLEGTIAAVTTAVLNGANIVRVHDVRACKRAVQIADALRGAP